MRKNHNTAPEGRLGGMEGILSAFNAQDHVFKNIACYWDKMKELDVDFSGRGSSRNPITPK